MLTKLTLILMLAISCQKLPLKSVQRQEIQFTRQYSVSSDTEAVDLFTVKLRYLFLLYEQEFDPLFKTQSWDPECLKATKIMNEVPISKGLLSISTVYMSPEFAPGFCPHNPLAKKGFIILLYCRKEKKMLQVRCWEADCAKTEWEDFC